MDSEALLKRWAATKTHFPEDQIESVEFEHADGWTSESGTGWPEETTAVVKGRRVQAEGRPGRLRTERVHCHSDVGELLREIMAVA